MNAYRMLSQVAETKAAEGGTTTEIVASTAAIDRMGDVVEQSWHLERYQRNPVALWAHDPTIPPVGRTVGLDVIGEGQERALVARIEWDTHEDNPLGRTVAAQFERGFLSAVSVGFVPGRRVARASLDESHPAYADGETRSGYLLSQNELLEISAVSIPANPEALVVGRAVSVGIKADDIEEIVRRAVETVLSESLPRAAAESVREAIRGDAAVRSAIEGIALASTLTDDIIPKGGDLDSLFRAATPRGDWFDDLPR